jgi:hypothetical protein
MAAALYLQPLQVEEEDWGLLLDQSLLDIGSSSSSDGEASVWSTTTAGTIKAPAAAAASCSSPVAPAHGGLAGDYSSAWATLIQSCAGVETYLTDAAALLQDAQALPVPPPYVPMHMPEAAAALETRGRAAAREREQSQAARRAARQDGAADVTAAARTTSAASQSAVESHAGTSFVGKQDAESIELQLASAAADVESPAAEPVAVSPNTGSDDAQHTFLQELESALALIEEAEHDAQALAKAAAQAAAVAVAVAAAAAATAEAEGREQEDTALQIRNRKGAAVLSSAAAPTQHGNVDGNAAVALAAATAVAAAAAAPPSAALSFPDALSLPEVPADVAAMTAVALAVAPSAQHQLGATDPAAFTMEHTSSSSGGAGDTSALTLTIQPPPSQAAAAPSPPTEPAIRASNLAAETLTSAAATAVDTVLEEDIGARVDREKSRLVEARRVRKQAVLVQVSGGHACPSRLQRNGM